MEIGLLDNNMEGQFGLEILLQTEKYVLIGQELDEKFKLERTSFLRIISGETLIAARKNKLAIKHVFTCHMACCGNKMLGYQDNKGELKRRIVPFMFDYKVLNSQVDAQLYNKLAKELPAVLQKCVLAYIECGTKYGAQSVWSVLPKYFTQASQRVAERNNPRRAFLESNEIVFGADFYVPESEFRKRFLEFCKQRNFGRLKFEFESWKSEFQDLSQEKGIKIEVQMRVDKVYPRLGGIMVPRENFIVGFDVKSDSNNIMVDCEGGDYE
jgi:phage/plasmid-associated DNA primase